MRSLIVVTALLLSTLYARAAEIGIEFNSAAYYYSAIKDFDDTIYLSVPGSGHLYLSTPINDHIAIGGLLDFYLTAKHKDDFSTFTIGATTSYALRTHKKNSPYLEIGLRTHFTNLDWLKDTNDLTLSLGYKKRFRSGLVLRPNVQYQRRFDPDDIRKEVYSLNISIGFSK